jgi:hypothetical protein
MKKKNIFITGLPNKPQGCGASVASAAGPFTKKTLFKAVIGVHIENHRNTLIVHIGEMQFLVLQQVVPPSVNFDMRRKGCFGTSWYELTN